MRMGEGIQVEKMKCGRYKNWIKDNSYNEDTVIIHHFKSILSNFRRSISVFEDETKLALVDLYKFK